MGSEIKLCYNMMLDLWGDSETIEMKVTKQRLEWLGHVARMSDDRAPKKTLFGWLTQTRPQGGPRARKRWKDQIRKDLKAVIVPESEWYDEATLSRGGWHAMGCRYIQRANSSSHSRMATNQPSMCGVRRVQFRRESDKKRHKCAMERAKPVQEQCGAMQCMTCQRWFRSRGGL